MKAWPIILLSFWVCVSTIGQAQDARRWAIEAKSPEGYRSTGDAARRVFSRRLKKMDAGSRIEVSIQKDDAKTAAAYLLNQKLGKETLMEGSSKSIELVGKSGTRLSFKGTFEFGNKVYNTERHVGAVKLEEGVFLRLSSQLNFLDDAPPQRLKRMTRTAMTSLRSSIKVKANGASTESSPNANVTGTVQDLNATYRSDYLFPFSFGYPEKWYVGDDTRQAPGSLQVIATPFAEQGPYAPVDTLPAALRVSVVGCLPELLGQADELGLATRLVKQRFQRADAAQTLDPSFDKSALLGSASGRLLRYQAKDRTEGQDGLILVIAVDLSVLVADFSWPATEGDAYSQQALAILNSFKVDFDRSVETVEEGGIAFDYPVNGWGLSQSGTSDRSTAWTLRRKQSELFIRSMPLKNGQSLTAQSLKKLCEVLLTRELGLTDIDTASDSSTFVLPRAELTWRCFFFGNVRARECFAMVRDGALHVAILSSPIGVRDFEAGQALKIFATLRGPKPASSSTVIKKFAFDSGSHLTSVDAACFGFDGTFLGPMRQRLIFRSDKTVTTIPGSPKDESQKGTYIVEQGGVKVAIGETRLVLSWADKAGYFQASDGRIWFTQNGF